MASQRITRADLYPDGTTVTAYPASNWSQAARPPSGAPVGSSEGTAGVMASGVATITGLTDGRDFFAYGLVSGQHRYVSFKASKSSGTTSSAAANLDRDNAQAGMYCAGPMFSPNLFTPIATRAYISRFVPSRDMTIASIVFEVSTAAGTDDAVDVGIYDAALARLVSKGATTGQLNSTGVKVQTVTPLQLRAGIVYYAGISFGTFGGTAAVVKGNTYLTAFGTLLFGGSVPQIECGQATATAHPLPTPLTLAGAPTAVPLLAVREA